MWQSFWYKCLACMLIVVTGILRYSLLIKLQAKGLVSEYQPKYNSARAVYRERKKYIDEIDWNMLAIPPSGSSKAFP